MGRFINADAFAATGQGLLGNNMFAYCNNNPVKYYDPSGRLMVGLLQGGADFYFGGSGWSSDSTVTANDTASSIHADTKENVADRMVEQCITTYNFLIDCYMSEPVQNTYGIKNIYNGCKQMREGFSIILTPIPTWAEEIIGIKLIANGVYSVYKGLSQLFGFNGG